MYFEINYDQWNKFLPHFLEKPQQKPLLVLGTSGIGKSATIIRAARNMGNRKEISATLSNRIKEVSSAELVSHLIKFADENVQKLPLSIADIRLADIPKEDFAGFPKVNEEKRRVDYLQLDFMSDLFQRPLSIELEVVKEKLTEALDAATVNIDKIIDILARYKGRILLFFDEINRMDPDMMQVIMELIDSRTLHQKPLKEEVRIIAAMNPMESAVYTTTSFTDVAFIRRWQRVLLLTQYSDWASYMGDKLNPVLDRFLRKYPDYFKREEEDMAPLNPAIWEEVNSVIGTEKDPALLEIKLGAIIGDSNVVRGLLKGAVAHQYEEMPIEELANILSDPAELQTLGESLTATWLLELADEIGYIPASAGLIWLVADSDSSAGTRIHEKVVEQISGRIATLNTVLEKLYEKLPSQIAENVYAVLSQKESIISANIVAPKSTKVHNTMQLDSDVDQDDLL